MTDSAILKKAKTTRALVMLVLTITLGIGLSGEMGKYILGGMELAVKCVIPSSFPFMIIADFYTHYGTPELLGKVGTFLCRIIGIPPHTLGAFICGNVGGFPIGAKMAADLYSVDKDDKEAIERLIPLSSNPSSAFVIGGVGLGMYNDIRIGIILLCSVYISMLLCAVITRQNTVKNTFSNNISRQKYSFVTSVKQAGASCVSLISFISIFSVAVGLIKNYVRSPLIFSSIITLLEVTNAVGFFADNQLLPLSMRIGFTGFALGFGGLSVMMQSAVFLENTELRMNKYVTVKLLQGVICATISTLTFVLLKQICPD